MALFSQRKGIKPLFKHPQVDDLDEETRNQIWTALKLCIFDHWSGTPFDEASTEAEHLYQRIWVHLFKLPIDSMPSYNPRDRQSAYYTLRSLTLEGLWHDALDLVEFIVKNAPKVWGGQLIAYINRIFEQENVGYRIVGHEIAGITDPVETEAVCKALATPKESIRAHLTKSLEFLSDRKAPDYRNSIKESISAVEAACQALTQKSGATLSDCLRTIKSKHDVPITLDQALTKLYAYTNDAGGIRHALTEQTSAPSFADARFMLVSCTAFINYLWTLAAEEGLDVG